MVLDTFYTHIHIRLIFTGIYWSVNILDTVPSKTSSPTSSVSSLFRFLPLLFSGRNYISVSGKLCMGRSK